MNYRGHILGGIVSYALMLFIFKIFHYPLDAMHNLQWFLFCILGSLFPDIDTKSKIQLWIYRLFILFYFLLLLINPTYYMLIFISILAVLPLIVRHRGIFHNPWFLIMLTLFIVGIIYFTRPDMIQETAFNALFFIAGTLSHLLLDHFSR